MNFLNFLKNTETDFKGRYLENIWSYSFEEIENKHDFIQLLFPLDKPSQSVFHGHYLKSKKEILEIQADEFAKKNIIKSSQWFLDFLVNSSNWRNKYDHNHLRISRIIQCLRLLISNKDADEFYTKILSLLEKKNIINSDTLEFWRKS